MAAQTPEIKQRVAFESERRARLAVPAVAGGVLYLLSGIILNASLKELPAVGIVQGLEPVLRGEPNRAVSPRAAEVKYIDHHAFGLIAVSVLTAIAVAALVLVLLFLADATRFRRPSWSAARPLALVGGIGFALLNIAHEAILAVEAHKFVTGSDFSNKAVDHALLTTGSAGIVLSLLGLLSALALAVGTIAVMVGSMRAGLMPRWLSMFGSLSGLLFLPFFGSTLVLTLIPTFWLVATGFLLMGRWPSGDPPAWAAGEARPWPTQAEIRAERQQENGTPASGRSRGLKDTGNGGKPSDVAPAPTPVPTPASGGSRRKRRKR